MSLDRSQRFVSAFLAIAVAWSIAGCAGYELAPLSTVDRLVRDAGGLRVDVAALPAVSLRTHVFDPSDGFDRVEIAMLAIANNPGLQLARADAGVQRAQAFAAGLLPDPQLGASGGYQLGRPAGSTPAYSVGVTFDVAALLAHSSLRAAGEADTTKADLTLLWQEWQMVAQAGVLFTKVVAQERTLDVLHRNQALFQDRYDRTRQAAERGLLASDAVTPHFTALQDVDRQINDLERQRNQSRHDLNTLVGVAPETTLDLADTPELAQVDEPQVRRTLAALLVRRPDLVALQYGYAAEDDRYRGALLQQFPTLTVNPSRGRDTTNVNSATLSIGVSIPVFNRNRGNIAIEKATRARLAIEYQNRLDTTTADVDRLLREQAILERQRREVAVALQGLEVVTSRAVQAFVARDIDALTLTLAQTALLAKQIERITLEQALAEQRIALQALVGADVPLVTPAPSGASR